MFFFINTQSDSPPSVCVDTNKKASRLGAMAKCSPENCIAEGDPTSFCIGIGIVVVAFLCCVVKKNDQPLLESGGVEQTLSARLGCAMLCVCVYASEFAVPLCGVCGWFVGLEWRSE